MNIYGYLYTLFYQYLTGYSTATFYRSTILPSVDKSNDVPLQTLKKRKKMKYPTTRFVFDRKNMATEKKDALIQVEVLLSPKKKYITTGVKVYKRQWSPKARITGRDDMLTLNERIDAVKGAIDNYINSLIKSGKPFDWYEFDRFLNREETKKETFIDFLYRRIGERTDIRESTKKNHRKLINSLSDFGKILTFSDLNRPNIKAYYEWLLGHEIVKIGSDGREYTTRLSNQTASSYMKTLRTYIHDAIVQERIDHDPSIGIRVKRGEYNQTKWLTVEEIRKIEDAQLSSGSLVRVRDLFVLCCYSGLAFADLMDFTPEKITKEKNGMMLHGKRVKTGNDYYVLILPKAKEILEKYGYNLPRYTNQQFNHRLKDVAKEAGIDKPISSHWARRSAGMMFLNNGIRIETVAKILGHSSTKITEQVYASILSKTVADEMSQLIK